MEYKPFKCPDCSVWWRGETHKCESASVKVTVEGKEVKPKSGGFTIPTPPQKQYCEVCKVLLGYYDYKLCAKHRNHKKTWNEKKGKYDGWNPPYGNA